jgi:hypothetical protein
VRISFPALNRALAPTERTRGVVAVTPAKDGPQSRVEPRCRTSRCRRAITPACDRRTPRQTPHGMPLVGGRPHSGDRPLHDFYIRRVGCAETENFSILDGWWARHPITCSAHAVGSSNSFTITMRWCMRRLNPASPRLDTPQQPGWQSRSCPAVLAGSFGWRAHLGLVPRP